MKNKEKLITIDLLIEKLNYDKETGIFYHKISNTNSIKIGQIAGTKHNCGYVQININNKIYLAHRLAWFYIYGKWPVCCIDHINGNRSDNRIINLREANRTENLRNMSIRPNNTTGYKGVSKSKSGKFTAQATVNYKNIFLGNYETAELASEAYEKYAKDNFGDFYRDTRHDNKKL